MKQQDTGRNDENSKQESSSETERQRVLDNKDVFIPPTRGSNGMLTNCSFRCPVEVKKQLRAIAAEYDTDMNAIILKAVREAIARTPRRSDGR